MIGQELELYKENWRNMKTRYCEKTFDLDQDQIARFNERKPKDAPEVVRARCGLRRSSPYQNGRSTPYQCPECKELGDIYEKVEFDLFNGFGNIPMIYYKLENHNPVLMNLANIQGFALEGEYLIAVPVNASERDSGKLKFNNKEEAFAAFNKLTNDGIMIDTSAELKKFKNRNNVQQEELSEEI